MYKVNLPIFIEVETSSFCNRTCTWCPNGWSKRGRRKEYISDEVWNDILNDLQLVDYEGWFAFHNYNEPLADPTIFEKIVQARQKLKYAKLVIFTNGDFLNQEILNKLIDVGINQIRIMLYPGKDSIFEEPKPQIIEECLTRLGIIQKDIFISQDWHFLAIVPVRNAELHIMAPRVQKYHNRGGSVPLKELSTPRTKPCFLPYRSAAIDYHGNLKLCCEIYDTTLNENQIYVIGNVAKEGFLKLWFSQKMNYYREQISKANFSEFKACQYCKYILDDDQLAELTPL